MRVFMPRRVEHTPFRQIVGVAPEFVPAKRVADTDANLNTFVSGRKPNLALKL